MKEKDPNLDSEVLWKLIKQAFPGQLESIKEQIFEGLDCSDEPGDDEEEKERNQALRDTVSAKKEEIAQMFEQFGKDIAKEIRERF
jgi:hypothetical protein